MKNAIPYLLLLPLALIVLFTQCEKEHNPVNIPDDAFLNALIEEGVDTNGDGIISHAEAEAVISLDVYGENISDLTGIELFVNLVALFCGGNQLSSLNVSNNTALTQLWCGQNQLTSLDVSNNTALIDLICANNQLTSLDVSNNTALERLSCSTNQLTSLDVSNNTALTELSCGSNQLSSLDVSFNAALHFLDCSYNQLTSLDVSNITALEWLDISEMPSLYEVCVWVVPFPPEGVLVNTTGSPNFYFTTECSK